MSSPSKFELIFYVADQQKSRDFYAAVLDKKPTLDVPGMTEFTLTKDLRLGLIPEENIAKIFGDKAPHPKTGSGIPRCELYVVCDNAAAAYDKAVEAGAAEISPVADRDWGDAVGYVADEDGHVLAFAQRKKETAIAGGASLDELYDTALAKASGADASGSSLLWEQLPAEEQNKLKNFFIDDSERGFLRYKQDDNNWTALTTHQVFGKKEGEFCCFQLGEIRNFQEHVEEAGSKISVNTAFENFDFLFEPSGAGEHLPATFGLFRSYWMQNSAEE